MCHKYAKIQMKLEVCAVQGDGASLLDEKIPIVTLWELHL